MARVMPTATPTLTMALAEALFFSGPLVPLPLLSLLLPPPLLLLGVLSLLLLGAVGVAEGLIVKVVAVGSWCTAPNLVT